MTAAVYCTARTPLSTALGGVSSRFLTAYQHLTVPSTLVLDGIHTTVDKLKIHKYAQTKHNPGKVNNAKHSKTKLPWFSRLS